VTPTFSALSNRNFRLFASGQLVSNTGTWMQRVAQDWLVLELSGKSGTVLGITTALQFLPLLLFSLWGGVIADRLPKRPVLIVTQSVAGLQALVLGVLTITGRATVWQVYILALVLGVVASLDTPVRQAFTSEMVSHRDLPNAVALGSATFNMGRVLGPAAAGVLIAVLGTGPVFLINAASYLAVIAGLLLMRTRDLHPAERVPDGKGRLREGLRYVIHRRDLLLAILIVSAVGTFGFNFQVTTALMATKVFHSDALAFGLLTTAFAVGSLLGALLSARRAGKTGSRLSLRLVVWLAVAFAIVESIAGLAPTYVSFLVLLIPTGLLAIGFATSANAYVQLGADPSVRGRVMAIYILLFFGGTPIGSLLIGWVAQTAGPRWSIIGGGLATLLCTVVLVLWLRPRTLRDGTEESSNQLDARAAA
jgi:MFS family permease